MPLPAQQARPLTRSFGHRRQIRLNVEACKFRMCQFSGGGHRVPGKVLAVAPISFSSLRNRSRANLSYPPLAGLLKIRNSHLAGNTILITRYLWQKRAQIGI